MSQTARWAWFAVGAGATVILAASLLGRGNGTARRLLGGVLLVVVLLWLIGPQGIDIISGLGGLVQRLATFLQKG